MANNRLFYAIKQVGFSKIGANSYIAAHGVQSVGMNTNFRLTPIFELGQLQLYENKEEIPDVEITLEKVLDGYPLLYHLATNGATGDSLSNRQNTQASFALALFADTKDSATTAPETKVWCSGMYVSSLQYSFPVSEPFKESLTLVGNHKVWYGGQVATQYINFSGQFTSNADVPLAAAASGNVNVKQNMVFDTATVTLDANNQVNASDCTILPTQIDGISSSGTNNRQSSGHFLCAVQGITVSVDLGREELFQLGQRTPFHRFVTFPTEVTTSIEVLAKSGDMISATEAGVLGNGNNLANSTIKIKTTEGTFLNLGTQNKLKSVSFGGGDAGGGNDSCTYSYSNYNYLVVTHPMNPST